MRFHTFLADELSVVLVEISVAVPIFKKGKGKSGQNIWR